MDSDAAKPRDSKQIYTAISQLVKGVGHESKRPFARTYPLNFFDYHLINVLDGDLFQYSFIGDTETIKPVEHIVYINEHIVHKQAGSYRIDFLKFSYLRAYLDGIKAYLGKRRNLFERLKTDFYKDILSHPERNEALSPIFKKSLSDKLGIYILLRLRQNKKIGNVFVMNWNNQPCVFLETDSALVATLRKDQGAQEIISNSLKEVYRYTGAFELSTMQVKLPPAK